MAEPKFSTWNNAWRSSSTGADIAVASSLASLPSTSRSNSVSPFASASFIFVDKSSSFLADSSSSSAELSSFDFASPSFSETAPAEPVSAPAASSSLEALDESSDVASVTELTRSSRCGFTSLLYWFLASCTCCFASAICASMSLRATSAPEMPYSKSPAVVPSWRERRSMVVLTARRVLAI